MRPNWRRRPLKRGIGEDLAGGSCSEERKNDLRGRRAARGGGGASGAVYGVVSGTVVVGACGAVDDVTSGSRCLRRGRAESNAASSGESRMASAAAVIPAALGAAPVLATDRGLRVGARGAEWAARHGGKRQREERKERTTDEEADETWTEKTNRTSLRSVRTVARGCAQDESR